MQQLVAAGLVTEQFFRETAKLNWEHLYRFLSLARELARNPDRHLFSAATLDEYLQDTNPLTSSILLDHDGRWQALVNLHPSASLQREPVQLPRQNVAPLLAV